MRLVLLCGIAAALATGCVTPENITPDIDVRALKAEQAFQRQLVVEYRREERVRLFTVSRRIFKANLDYCQSADRTRQSLGFLAETIADYPKEWQGSAADGLGIGLRPSIIAVQADGPAAAAGLRPGDTIAAINGAPLAEAGSANTLAKTYRDLAQVAADSGPVKLDIVRNGRTLDLVITPEESCDYDVWLKPSTKINAYATGRSVVFFRGMMKMLTDDNDLALIFAHELAHNVLGHISVSKGPSVMRMGSKFEAEADYVGLYMMARAGYDISGAAEFWRRMAVENPAAVMKEGSHPTTAARFLSLEAARQEIQSKMDSGEPLAPKAKPEI